MHSQRLLFILLVVSFVSVLAGVPPTALTPPTSYGNPTVDSGPDGGSLGHGNLLRRQGPRCPPGFRTYRKISDRVSMY